MIKKKINEDKIYNIAEKFRLAILNAKSDGRFHYKDRMSNFPSGNRKIIIDITATQFMFCGEFSKDIYVGKSFSFCKNLDRVKICENYDITQSERLWNDYQIIMSYLSKET